MVPRNPGAPPVQSRCSVGSFTNRSTIVLHTLEQFCEKGLLEALVYFLRVPLEQKDGNPLSYLLLYIC